MLVTNVNKKLPPFDQSHKFLQVFITVVEALKDMVYIFYYEIHLKYCQDMDVYR